jgi:hypothetical protein
MREAMQGIEERIDARIATLGAGINAHTSQASETLGSSLNTHIAQRFNATSTSQAVHHVDVLEQLRLLDTASQEYNHRMVGIQHGISNRLL